MKEILWKYNLNSIKDVPKVYVYFIMIEIIVSEKNEAILSYHPSHIFLKNKVSRRGLAIQFIIRWYVSKAGQGSLTMWRIFQITDLFFKNTCRFFLLLTVVPSTQIWDKVCYPQMPLRCALWMNLSTLQILKETVKNCLLNTASASLDVQSLDTEQLCHLEWCFESLLWTNNMLKLRTEHISGQTKSYCLTLLLSLCITHLNAVHVTEMWYVTTAKKS